MNKKNISFWKVLEIYCFVMFFLFLILFTCFFFFLRDYQNVYDREQPEVQMSDLIDTLHEQMYPFLDEYLTYPKLGNGESKEHYLDVTMKKMNEGNLEFEKADGEYIETRPVYVISASGKPMLKVYYKKADELAKYRITKYEISKVVSLLEPNSEFVIDAPIGAKVEINGILLEKPTDEEKYFENANKKYFGDAYELEQMVRYSVADTYGEIKITASREDGEILPVCEVKEKIFEVAYRDSSFIKQEQKEYALEFVKQYALCISNDESLSRLDKYFPPKSKILYSIKNSDTRYYDAHNKPSIINDEVKRVTSYSKDAFSARVYLEEVMFVPYRKEEVTEKTDIEVFFCEIDGKYKVVGINFRPQD